MLIIMMIIMMMILMMKRMIRTMVIIMIMMMMVMITLMKIMITADAIVIIVIDSQSPYHHGHRQKLAICMVPFKESSRPNQTLSRRLCSSSSIFRSTISFSRAIASLCTTSTCSLATDSSSRSFSTWSRFSLSNTSSKAWKIDRFHSRLTNVSISCSPSSNQPINQNNKEPLDP